ncbi:MAG: polyprenyl synthetase family protein [bacterium]|nr:polyprenyl synthetase family protein [bacterium]
MKNSEDINLKEALKRSLEKVNRHLEIVLRQAPSPSQRLKEAMVYGVLNGGKRLRAFLIFQIGELLELPERILLNLAAAVECVHAYSLLHDDLPCMDDAPLRRGKPTCYRVFDEATTMLAGNSLLTLAFQLILDLGKDPQNAQRCNQVISKLCEAIGAAGMMSGQALDLTEKVGDKSVEETLTIDDLKTGAFFRFICVAPALLSDAPDEIRLPLEKFGRHLGHAFQLQDDLLDLKGATEDGKMAGQDIQRGCVTTVSLLGPQKVEERLMQEIQEGQEALSPFKEKGELLNALIKSLLRKTS